MSVGSINTGPGSGAGYDLLKVAPIRRLILWRGFPSVFQAAMLAVFIALAALGWGRLTPEGVPDKLYAKSNLVNLAIWGLFWPSVVWMTVLLGRVWCAICPLELVSDLTERLGRALGVPQRRVSRWLRAGWLMVAAYALIQLLVAGVHLHRVPGYTSVFLVVLLSLAAISGIVFRNRAFCRTLCPVAPLLWVYGRGGAVAVRPATADRCGACGAKHCAHPLNRDRLDARSCPSLLNPEKLSSSEECLACAQCVKACAPGNMALLIRPPYHSADRRRAAAPWALTVFVMLLSGFVTAEVASEWAAAQKVFHMPVHWFVRFTGLHTGAGWIEGAWALFLMPALLWLALGGLVVLFRGARGLAEAWRVMALPMAVVIAAGHMSKGLAKLTSWAGFLPGALRDPDGVGTAAAIAAKAMPQPAAVLPLPVVAAIGASLTAAALWFAVREHRLIEGSPRLARILPQIVVAAAYSFVIFGWGFLQ